MKPAYREPANRPIEIDLRSAYMPRNAYNHPVVIFSSSSRFSWLKTASARAALALGAAIFFTLSVLQAQAPTSQNANPAGGGAGGILLVMPFDNRTGQPSLEWIREAAPEILSSRFASAGFAPMSRADRLYALDHLGLPQGFQPSRASEIRLAQTLDADSIIVGSYLTDGTGIVAEAQIVDVPHLRMSEPVTARGEMRDLIKVYDELAWKLTRQLDSAFTQPEETFIAAGAGLRLEAFEQYIRGISEADQQERLRHLTTATELSPDFTKAWLALAREEFSAQQYEKSAVAFAKVSGRDADGLEAGFYRGLSLLFSGDYPHAELAFASVAQVLPLAEVLNNQGVALSRQGHDGSALFRQALAADPAEADYHFNLAVTLKRQKHAAEAGDELAECLKLRPGDAEAEALDAAWKAPASAAASAEVKTDALERIERNFDAVAFRQAAATLDQMDAARMAALAPHERAVKLAAEGSEYLNRGLLLEAERLFQSAIAADSADAAAHAGLAAVRERTGDQDAARREASAALQLDPDNQAAKDLLQKMDAVDGQKK
jgi:tetratricopeptide (TPR) repeat protein